jgi:hypothetical protein
VSAITGPVLGLRANDDGGAEHGDRLGKLAADVALVTGQCLAACTLAELE